MTQPEIFSAYDRRSFAAEMFITDRTSFFPGRDGWTAQEMKEYISDAPVTARFALVRDIRLAVREVYRRCQDPEGIIPARFKPLGGRLTLPLLRSELLTDYVDWLEELRSINDEARSALGISLTDILTRLDDLTADFISNVRRMASLRCVVLQEGSDLLVSFAERDWGKAVLRFPNASLEEQVSLPLPCYFCTLQGEYSDESCRFYLLGDTEFSQGEYCLRALNNKNWQPLVFSSDLPELELIMHDYPRIYRLCGMSGFELVESCCEALVSKEMICGTAALTPGERSYLTAAKLINGLSQMKKARRREDSERARPQVLGALDDRYSCRILADRFQSVIDGKISDQLHDGCQRLVDGDADGAVRSAFNFYRLLRESFERGISHDSIYDLAEDMCAMTDTLECPEHPFYAAADCAREMLSPELERLGFSGTFPHFSRKMGIERQFVSVLLRPDGDRAYRGVLGYELRLACGRTYDQRVSDFARGEDMSAADCGSLKPHIADYTELCSADDGDRVILSVDTLNDCEADFDHELVIERLAIASRCMRGGKIPVGYAARRQRARGFWRNLLQAVNDSAYVLPVTAILLLGGYMLARQRVQLLADVEPQIAAIAGLGCALAVFAVNAVGSFIRSKGKFWRQR